MCLLALLMQAVQLQADMVAIHRNLKALAAVQVKVPVASVDCAWFVRPCGVKNQNSFGFLNLSMIC